MNKRHVSILMVLALVLLVVSCASKEEKRARFFNKGKALYAKGDRVRAELEFKNALQIDPKCADAYLMLGKIELENKDYKKAFGLFSKAAELDADLLEAHVQMGKIYLMARQVDKARSKFSYVLDKEPGHQQGRLLEAGVLLAEKKPAAAKERLENLMADGFTDPQVYLAMAAIQINEGNEKLGRQTLRNGIAANPDNLRLRGMLASALVRSKSFDEAIKVVEEAIEIDPENKGHKMVLASIYWQSGQKAEVERLFNQMIAEEDDPASVYILATDFYAKAKAPDAALRMINKGIEKMPGNIKLRLALSYLQITMRQHDKALETLNSALGLAKDDADPDLLKVKNQLARLHLYKAEIDSAKKYLDEIIAVSPNNVDAQFTAGQIYLRQKDGLNAVSAFRMVTAEKPGEVMGYLLLAQAHLLQNEKQLAIDVLANGLTANPSAVELRKALARIHAFDKDDTEAEKQLRLIVDQRPEDPRARSDLADFLFSIKREDESIAIYKKMVDEQPRIPAGYLKLAAIYQAQKKPAERKAVLEKGYKTIPQSIPVLTSLVKAYLAVGDQDKALGIVRERLEKNNQDMVAHNLLGEIFVTRKQFSAAKQAFEKAIAIKSDWQVPYNNLVRVYLTEGKKDEAIANLNKAIEKNPNNAAAYMTLGQLYLKDGQKEKVIDTYEKALTALPTLWPAANNLAYVLAQNGDKANRLKQAQALAMKAVNLQPERPDVIDTLGWVYFQRGEVDLAIAEFEKAIKRAPDSAIINFHMGLALMKVNRLDEAREMLEKAAADEDFPEREAAVRALEDL